MVLPGRSVPLSFVQELPASVLSGKTAAEVAREHGGKLRERGIKREVKKEGGVKIEKGVVKREERIGGSGSGVVVDHLDLDETTDEDEREAQRMVKSVKKEDAGGGEGSTRKGMKREDGGVRIKREDG